MPVSVDRNMVDAVIRNLLSRLLWPFISLQSRIAIQQYETYFSGRFSLLFIINLCRNYYVCYCEIFVYQKDFTERRRNVMQWNKWGKKAIWCSIPFLIIGIVVICAPFFTTAVSSAGLPLTDFTLDDFVGSDQCAACHSGLTDRSGHDVSIDAHWRSTLMANSAKDPLWQAKMSSEVLRNPALQEVIEDKCATCHTPMARTQATVTHTPVALLEDGFFDASHALHEAALDGVSCTLCHQIQDKHLGEKDSFSGHYTIQTATSPPDRLIFGPYPDPVQNMMRNNVGFTPLKGSQVKDSALCGICHTLYTPYVDAEGTVLGEFPEQTPYLEWKQSAYGDGNGDDVTCQECHMPAADGAVVISNRPRRGLSLRSPFSQHHFVGGNMFMLGLLSKHSEQIGVTASSDDLDETMARTQDQLQMASARLSILDARRHEETLEVVLQVTNLAGHKFPTGFPSRRAWIHLTVTDAGGHLLFESGRPQADGRISGNDADQNPGAYEPHYTKISDSEQVQIYEAIMRNSDGDVTYTLLRGAAYAKDNRVLPHGFEKSEAAPDIAVRGVAESDANFLGGEDRIVFEASIAGQSGPLTVSAQLVYQTLSSAFAHDLFQDSTIQTDRFAAYYANADKKPVVVATVEHIVQ